MSHSSEYVSYVCRFVEVAVGGQPEDRCAAQGQVAVCGQRSRRLRARAGLLEGD